MWGGGGGGDGVCVWGGEGCWGAVMVLMWVFVCEWMCGVLVVLVCV